MLVNCFSYAHLTITLWINILNISRHLKKSNSGNELRHDAIREAAPRYPKLRKYAEYSRFGSIPYKGKSDQPQCVIV